MAFHTGVYSRRQTRLKPVQPADRPGQILEVVQIGTERLGVLGIGETEKHAAMVTNATLTKKLIHRAFAQAPSRQRHDSSRATSPTTRPTTGATEASFGG